jgi:hypothetical protein
LGLVELEASKADIAAGIVSEARSQMTVVRARGRRTENLCPGAIHLAYQPARPRNPQGTA